MNTAASCVDPLHGTDHPGNCLPGPYLPFGLVRPGPDTLPGGFERQVTNGYYSAHPLTGFSHTHVSGTGGGGRYGNLLITPFTGPPRSFAGPYDREGETAELGYYRTGLAGAGITAELTATARCGVHRFMFSGGGERHLLLDLGAVVQVMNGFVKTPGNGTGGSVGGFVEQISQHEIVGRADYKGGWGHQYPYSVHFYLRTFQPVAKVRAGTAAGLTTATSADGPCCKALLSFGDASTVDLRVGISFRSIANARRSVERECGALDFDALRAEAVRAWEPWLNRLRVEGGAEADRRMFYTLLSRLLCMPSDLGVDDEFPLWEGGVRHFSDYYAVWDSCRNANGLLSLFAPETEAALLNCLLDVADHLGWLPDAWIAGHYAMAQGGSCADLLFCEAALKGLPGIDYDRALAFMLKNGEQEPPDAFRQGRAGLAHYKSHGWVPSQVSYSASRHLEYAYQDWCAGRLAAFLGKEEAAERQFAAAARTWNLWRDDIKCAWPRSANGIWVEDFDPLSRWTPHFYEQTAESWSMHVPHDFHGLIARHGGPEAFVHHLDAYFESNRFYTKETLLHIPWLYIHAGRPDRTADVVRRTLRKCYGPGRNGLFDNEDMGCQSAFFLCSAMGLYPLMGQDLYWLTAPLFERTQIQLGEQGPILTIEAPGAGDARPHVASATLNGRPLDHAWLHHHEIAKGGTLSFELAAGPTFWGRGRRPPTP